MFIFTDVVAPEYFLYYYGLLSKIKQVLFVGILEFLQFELLAGVVGSKMRLNFDGGSFFS